MDKKAANFLPHFHYNKDWNITVYHKLKHMKNYFLPHFHYNKDWNLSRVQ